ncbi:putative OSM3-like kinesin [Trypanosoma grayi]|uniref:putative OSM3-like kinesin n=1 Tax=Trypanosoma grayi TaxID=71804 RepID=UPI0004F4A65E|nr:putative OSM3-like kinesin [Trypanosoma grayi]KEG14127.1 putative OSM3-like kinesin [Trypanosoma grayi]
MSSDPAFRLEELQSQINVRNAALQARLDSVMGETGETELPQLEELKEERVRLMRDIQHHKDEGDAKLVQIEAHEGASAMYRVAARVQRFEDFANHAAEYVEKELPEEINRVAEADKRHSEDEVAAYIADLQSERAEELRKINVLKERTAKRAKEIRNGPRVEHEEVTANSRAMKPKEDEIDRETKETMNYTDEAKSTKGELVAKIKKLRQEKSKLQVSLLDAKHKSEKEIHELEASIRRAEIANTRDVRLCQQLNTGNAALTTNAQILLGQLNVEHYGVEGGPTEKMLINMRQEEAKTVVAAAENGNKTNGCNGGGTYQRNDTENSNGAASGVSSRRASIPSKPPLVALKRTESQRNRDAATEQERREKEEAASVGISPARSRGADSVHSGAAVKPPLVASKPTSSQRNREAAVRADLEHRREEDGSAARSQRRGSESSLPAVALMKTESSRNREVASRRDSKSSSPQ